MYRSYTNIEQSVELSKFLPSKTADMHYDGYTCQLDEQDNIVRESIIPSGVPSFRENFFDDAPAWSLAALLSIIPDPSLEHEEINGDRLWKCAAYYREKHRIRIVNSNYYTEPVDACVALVIKLQKEGLLKEGEI